jgi:pseudouridine-5'-phosphate glycosidase
VEQVVRDHGATPATIAIVAGEIHLGLGDDTLEQLATAKDVVKASSRDLAAVMARGGSAGTTVSATMRIAELAGIDIFATGGVGGVHRGAEATFDISADLTELGNTGTAVVCAGVKSILDIPKTLEFLETQRVPVIAYGTDDFPAFYTRSSGLKADHRLDSAKDIARAMLLHKSSGQALACSSPTPFRVLTHSTRQSSTRRSRPR